MSNVETKQVVAKNLFQYTMEVQTLVQAGWTLIENSIRNNTVTYRASFVRGATQDTDKVKTETVEKVAEKTEPKTATEKKAAPKVVKTEVTKDA